MSKIEADDEGTDLVELDALDGNEWNAGQATPQVGDAKLDALVKQTANAPAAATGPKEPRRTMALPRVMKGPATPPGGAPAPANPFESPTLRAASTPEGAAALARLEQAAKASKAAAAAATHKAAAATPAAPARSAPARTATPVKVPVPAVEDDSEGWSLPDEDETVSGAGSDVYEMGAAPVSTRAATAPPVVTRAATAPPVVTRAATAPPVVSAPPVVTRAATAPPVRPSLPKVEGIPEVVDDDYDEGADWDDDLEIPAAPPVAARALPVPAPAAPRASVAPRAVTPAPVFPRSTVTPLTVTPASTGTPPTVTPASTVTPPTVTPAPTVTPPTVTPAPTITFPTVTPPTVTPAPTVTPPTVTPAPASAGAGSGGPGSRPDRPEAGVQVPALIHAPRTEPPSAPALPLPVPPHRIPQATPVAAMPAVRPPPLASPPLTVPAITSDAPTHFGTPPVPDQTPFALLPEQQASVQRAFDERKRKTAGFRAQSASKRPLIIAGIAGAIGFAIVMFALTRHGSHAPSGAKVAQPTAIAPDPEPTAPPDPAPDPATDPAAGHAATTDPVAIAAADPATGSADPTTPPAPPPIADVPATGTPATGTATGTGRDPATTTAATGAGRTTGTGTRPTTGKGKSAGKGKGKGTGPTVAVATPATPTVTPPAVDLTAARDRAKAAYEAGNERLFAGDPAGAIKAYREALQLYPGFAAGHRGLGLAYAQQGDKARALENLQAYVKAAPNAKDVNLIKQRIASMQ